MLITSVMLVISGLLASVISWNEVKPVSKSVAKRG